MQTELAIIGAGPAGLAAAEIAVAYGIAVTIIDEQPRPGGQIHRQPPKNFHVRNWLSNTIYKEVRHLVTKVSALDGIHWLSQTTVLGIADSRTTHVSNQYQLTLNNDEGTATLTANYILIAPGCYDLPVIFPGWNLPGVMATGGIQAFIKSQQIIPGERFVFVGTHPLQLIVAEQILHAGGQVSAVVFAQPFAKVFQVFKSPSVLIRHSKKFMYIAAAIFRLRQKGVPIRFSETVIQANGSDHLTSVDLAPIDSKGNVNKANRQSLVCDRLGICFGFLASSELARQAGAHHQWSATSGGWVIQQDKGMRTNRPRLFVAGEITGVAGAEAAIQEGKLAALSIALELNKLTTDTASRLTKTINRQLKNLNQFASILNKLAYPGKHLLLQLMTNTSILCKCEEVSVAAFQHCLEDTPPMTNANAAKLCSRAGMGLCQGRYCNYPITKLIADKLGISEESIDPFTARFPAKPVSIKSLLAKNTLENNRP